jgi:putative nucleotidyltransferase with HDIG domain
MQQSQLNRFKTWFSEYVAGFYGNDPYVNAHIKIKEGHTHRTCREMLFISDELGLGENENQIAETIALFHDIGRFKQFREYRTFNDLRSIDHSLLGVQVLREEHVLQELDSHEIDLIETAIEYHGRKELPKNLNDRHLLFSKLIRDADKLDVYYVVIENYSKHTDSPQQQRLESELPDLPEYSPEVIETLLAGRLIDYQMLRTLNDMKLCQLGWVYDVNFVSTLKKIKQREFMERLVALLPQTPDIEQVKARILDYVDDRIRRQA